MRIRMTIGVTLALCAVASTAWAAETKSEHHRAARNAREAAGKPPSTHRQRAEKTATGATQVSKRDSEVQAVKKDAAPTRRRAVAANANEASARNARDQSPLSRDEYIGPMRPVGQREVGSAAWYGGWHVGHRTANGEMLDDFHATAAHRTLPLDTLVRVTNLRNGRSCIAKINDRGPVSRSLLIDVSPAVADQLDMRRSGIAQVSVEPVAPSAKTTR